MLAYILWQHPSEETQTECAPIYAPHQTDPGWTRKRGAWSRKMWVWQGRERNQMWMEGAWAYGEPACAFDEAKKILHKSGSEWNISLIIIIIFIS